MNRNPKGCSNIGGTPAAKLEYCRNRALELFAFYGYRPFSPAELQLIEDVWDKISAARAGRLIALTSPFGEPCVLRGDLTLSAVTYLASHFQDEERPLRLSYADRIFSAPQPPKHNLEENQVGVELIGWEGAGADAEVISLLLRVLDELSIDSTVVLGDMSVISKIFAKLPGSTGKVLTDALQDGSYTSYMNILSEIDISESDKKLLTALPQMKGGISVIDDAMKMLDDPSILMPLKNLCSSLAKLGFAERIRIDLGFIRDLGYYSGPIFNAYSKSGSLLGGGGRYDGLLTKIGMDGEAAGFALDLKELADCCDGSLPSPQLMVWCGSSEPADCLMYADELRRSGVSFELSWHGDKDESMRIARLRKYKWWIDFAAKKIISLGSGESKNIDSFDMGALSC
jgi:ATP phosphoribosyltransferase regulatory subunit